MKTPARPWAFHKSVLSVLGQLLLGCCFRSFHRDIDTFRSVATESLIWNADSTAKQHLSILSWALTKRERIQQNSKVYCPPGPWSDETFTDISWWPWQCWALKLGPGGMGQAPDHQAISAALLLSWLFYFEIWLWPSCSHGFSPPSSHDYSFCVFRPRFPQVPLFSLGTLKGSSSSCLNKSLFHSFTSKIPNSSSQGQPEKAKPMKYNENLLWKACSPQSVYNRPKDLFLDDFINGTPWGSRWLFNLEIHSLLRCYAWSFLYFVFKRSNYCSAWWHTTLIPTLGSTDRWICVSLRLNRVTK